jgi:hypothetical protein
LRRAVRARHETPHRARLRLSRGFVAGLRPSSTCGWT